MALSTGASLIFLSLSVFLVMWILFKYAKLEERGILTQILAFIGVISLFFNLFLAETFMFFENAVMALGVLFCVIAACFFITKEGWRRYVYSLVFLILGFFSYQASMAYFIPLIILFSGIKYDWNLKTLAHRTIFSGLLYSAALLTNYFFILIVNAGGGRVAGGIDFADNVLRMILAFRRIISSSLGFTPRFVFFAALAVLFMIILYKGIKSKRINCLIACIASFAALAFAAMINHLPMTVFYVHPRSALALAGLGGLMIICMALMPRASPNFIAKPVAIAAFAFLMLISVIHIDAQRNSFANNLLDRVEISAIAQGIWTYEERTGITINLLQTIQGRPVMMHRPYFRDYMDVTVRALSVPWMVHPMISHYMGRMAWPWESATHIPYSGFLDHVAPFCYEMKIGENRLFFVEDILYLVIY
ncbi:MAG: glucosyltransferase domain-containing protein [Clostridiales bacterium]|jgi:hypothetical protein|nr:glucosyltransferase domain-containing protein [Clostridiales bacterium]